MSRKQHSIALMLTLVWPALAIANPVGPSVVAGDASFSHPTPEQLNVKANNQAIIHWQDFSIKHGEVVKFIQPTSQSTVLNRVVTANPSALLGTLEANGRVYLINPNGVLVGKEGMINTAGFAASTLDISNETFLQNGDLLFQGNSKASVVNYGTINAWDGDVTLIGYAIDNQGKISAPNGAVALGAGPEILLKPSSDEKLFIRPRLNDQERSGIGLNNSGQIEALQTELKADGNPYALAIKHSGSIDALDVQKVGGRIMLVAEGGYTEVGGALSSPGGEIKVLGERVHVTDHAVIDASGANGGGNVYVGGGLRGQNPSIYNAMETTIDAGAVIQADAKTVGNGGQVIVWSGNDTEFRGQISAQGGAESGDGGFVEVSGKHLGFKGKVNTSAPQGSTGELLLDPTDIWIQNAGATTLNSSTIGTTTTFYDTNIPISILTIPDLIAALAANNVVVTTDSIGPANGDITIVDPITYAGNNNLSFFASRDILFNSSLTNNAGSATFTFNAGRDLIMSGNHPFFSNSSSTLNLNVGRNFEISNEYLFSARGSLNAFIGLDCLFSDQSFVEIYNTVNFNIARNFVVDQTSRSFFGTEQLSGASNILFNVGENISVLNPTQTNQWGDVGKTATFNCENFTLGTHAQLRTNGILTINAVETISLENSSKIFFSGQDTQSTVNLNAGLDILASPGTIITAKNNTSANPITLIADRNIILNEATLTAHGTQGDIILVADNAFPISPEKGPGFVSLPDTNLIALYLDDTEAPIRVFSSIRGLDDFTGTTLNGSSFVPGTELVNTSTEQWGVYYPSSFGGTPYTMFYKNTSIPVPPPPPPPPSINVSIKELDRYLAAIAEPFDMWRQFDYFHFGDDLVSFAYVCDEFCGQGLTCEEDLFVTVPFEFDFDNRCVMAEEMREGGLLINRLYEFNLHRAYQYIRAHGPIDWITSRLFNPTCRAD